DMVNWSSAGNVVGAVPSWVATATNNTTITDLWAPQITYRNGGYWVYYCASVFGTRTSVIGLATNPTLDRTSPLYKWIDQGEVYSSVGSTTLNAIDPNLFVDQSGQPWLLFGSWSTGIKMFAIDPATGMRSTSNTTVYSLAGRSSSGLGIEGPTMAWHDGYYYLFTSWDVCCQGVSSTYNTRVVRSASITGPYVDKNGASAVYGTGNGTLWLSRYGRYIGPGGGTCYKQGERDFMVHHYYDGDAKGNAELLFREIVWGDDGWPVAGQPFLGRYLSAEAEHAVLANDTILESATASDGEYVSGTSSSSNVSFALNIPNGGDYRLRIRYANANASSTSQSLQVNSQPAITVSYPKTSAWGTFPQADTVSENVHLKAGTNILKFTPSGTAYVQLDRIDLLRGARTSGMVGAVDNGYDFARVDSTAVTLQTGSWMLLENVEFGAGGDSLSFRYKSTSAASISVRPGTRTATPLLAATLPSTSGTWTTLSLPAKPTGTQDIYITVESAPSAGFQFSSLMAKDATTGLRAKAPPTPGFSKTGIQRATGIHDAEGRSSPPPKMF
ncbi:MAG TPA: family 43 glycosylhydrolase, partial [Fibrobacteria bacterium]|nr:family 43 glycosylhydrolase [Fibrobacteria bacterium]